MRFRLLPNNPDVSWIPYAWLIYLSFFIIWPIAQHASLETWLLNALGLAIFLPLYFTGYWIKGPRILWIIAALFLLGCLYAPINPGSNVFFVYSAAFVRAIGDHRLARRVLVVHLTLLLIVAYFLHFPFYYWIGSLVFGAIIGAINIHFAQRHRMNQQLHLAREQVEHLAKVAERERIARDLHDLLGHTLSVIILKSELASRLSEKDPARATQEIRDVERISRDALAQVRQAVQGYQSTGLAAEFEQAKQTLETAGLQVDLSLEPARLTPQTESVLALAVREAVTNVVRHAHATRCSLHFHANSTAYELAIADNGRGGPIDEGSGLRGMRDRVESLGGTLERIAGEGLTLKISLPPAPAGLV